MKALVIQGKLAVVVLVGIPPNEARRVNLSPIISRELQLRGTMRFNDEIGQAVALLDSTPHLGRVITHEFPAHQAPEAFATATDSNISGKVLISLW